MNNCDNWYEMTEQALSTINKLMPTEVSDSCIEVFPAIQQSIPATSSKPTASSSISMSPNTSSHVSLATLQDNKNLLLESRRPYSDDCDNENQTNDNIHSNGAPCADSIGQKLKNTSPPDQFPVEKDVAERQVSVGRGVTLTMLLADSLIKAGTDALSFEHSGETFVADLLADGKIRWNKEERIFHCTSSWIVHCKKTSFPHEKLTCSITEQVKYKGKSLDHYKLAWLKKHKPFVNNIDSQADDDLEMDREYHQQDVTRMNTQMEDDEPELNWILGCSSSMVNYQESIPHSKLGRRSFQGIPNLFVECSSFTKMNRVQPFKLNITKNCLLLLHFHCHLLGSEVLGYLAGKWDSTAQQLIVSQAYPCKCSLNAQKDETDRVEYDIMTNMDKSNLILVGWYHSHVGCPSDPSLRDVETQMEYQFQLKGYESATFQPCVGLVISPFHMQSPAQLTSDMKIFYVYPPSEQRPLDYGMPLEVEHTISKDDYVTDRIISEMEKLIKFYSNDPDYLPKKFKKSNLPVYLNRLKNCLSPFCPSGYLSESIVKVFENF